MEFSRHFCRISGMQREVVRTLQILDCMFLDFEILLLLNIMYLLCKMYLRNRSALCLCLRYLHHLLGRPNHQLHHHLPKLKLEILDCMIVLIKTNIAFSFSTSIVLLMWIKKIYIFQLISPLDDGLIQCLYTYNSIYICIYHWYLWNLRMIWKTMLQQQQGKEWIRLDRYLGIFTKIIGETCTHDRETQKNFIWWLTYWELVRCHPKRENKDVMMNEMADAHEKVSCCIIIIPWLLKKHAFESCKLVLQFPKEIRALMDGHKQEFWLHAFAFCLLSFAMFNILFCELACLSMLLHQDINRLLEAQSKLVKTNTGLKEVSWMKKISAVIGVKNHYFIFRHFKHWFKIYSIFRLFEFCKPYAYWIKWFHFFGHIRIWMQPIVIMQIYKQPLASNRSQFPLNTIKKITVFSFNLGSVDTVREGWCTFREAWCW